MKTRVDMPERQQRYRRGRRSGAWLLAAIFATAAGAGSGMAQSPAIPDSALVAELQTLASRAGTIFVGQITAIERKGGTVEVSFRVEQPLRGSVGAAYVMREWAGNWAPGQPRYSVGQRVLAFVHGVSGGGFCSPVHGAEGLVPVIVQGADVPGLLDIRRVAASVVRAPGTPLPTEADGALPLTTVLTALEQATPSTSAVPVRQPVPVRGWRPVEGATNTDSRTENPGGQLHRATAFPAGTWERLQ